MGHQSAKSSTKIEFEAIGEPGAIECCIAIFPAFLKAPIPCVRMLGERVLPVDAMTFSMNGGFYG
jgi:hypothetical protein